MLISFSRVHGYQRQCFRYDWNGARGSCGTIVSLGRVASFFCAVRARSMDAGEAELAQRLKSIVETEGSTTVQPDCLADGPAPLLESSFRGSHLARPCAPPKLSPAPKGWWFLLIGLIVGLVIAAVVFLLCRKSEQQKPSNIRKSKKISLVI